ncbi:MAG: hypothetical protein R3F37_05925 [Candidatus Competibacteraceae bacterium]
MQTILERDSSHQVTCIGSVRESAGESVTEQPFDVVLPGHPFTGRLRFLNWRRRSAAD